MNRLRLWLLSPLLIHNIVWEKQLEDKFSKLEGRLLRRLDELQATSQCKVVPMAVHQVRQEKLPEAQSEWMKDVDWERVNGGAR